MPSTSQQISTVKNNLKIYKSSKQKVSPTWTARRPRFLPLSSSRHLSEHSALFRLSLSLSLSLHSPFIFLCLVEFGYQDSETPSVFSPPLATGREKGGIFRFGGVSAVEGRLVGVEGGGLPWLCIWAAPRRRASRSPTVRGAARWGPSRRGTSPPWRRRRRRGRRRWSWGVPIWRWRGSGSGPGLGGTPATGTTSNGMVIELAVHGHDGFLFFFFLSIDEFLPWCLVLYYVEQFHSCWLFDHDTLQAWLRALNYIQLVYKLVERSFLSLSFFQELFWSKIFFIRKVGMILLLSCE